MKKCQVKWIHFVIEQYNFKYEFEVQQNLHISLIPKTDLHTNKKKEKKKKSGLEDLYF